ncbi:MAG: hypothetical protein M0T78_08815 [Actinomycetota bacterium]|nr:hypothetical protein [Actinomycetota bacterium]
MNATLLLCDAAVIADSKLFILGGGWSLIGPGPAPMAIAIKVDVDFNVVSEEHHWELFLEETNGEAVILETPDGPRPVEVRGDFRVSAPDGNPIESATPINMAINLGPLPLAPGRSYMWRMTINGQSDANWSAFFSTRSMPEFPVDGLSFQ